MVSKVPCRSSRSAVCFVLLSGFHVVSSPWLTNTVWEEMTQSWITKMDFVHTYVLIPKEEENTNEPAAEHENGDSEENIEADS